MKSSGRVFRDEDLRLAQQIVADYPGLSIHELSLTLCELLGWRRPNGRLKSQECRAWLQRLHAEGVVSLPALRNCGPQGSPRICVSSQGDAPESELRGEPGSLEPLRVEIVDGGREESARFREWIDRYHYLGYRVPVGANLRYVVRSAGGEALACLLWSSPAWKMAARDRWIGWSARQRERNLQYVVNNSRFLILPWVRVKGLASKILSRCARQLPWDWEQRYGYRPLLLETLVETERFAGTSYRAANWLRVGQTQGRGRMDRDRRQPTGSRKDIYLYALCRHVQQRLQTAAPPGMEPVNEPNELSAGQNGRTGLCFSG